MTGVTTEVQLDGAICNLSGVKHDGIASMLVGGGDQTG
jgi:hypothetical protein